MASHDGRQFIVWTEAFIRPSIQRPGSWYYGGASVHAPLTGGALVTRRLVFSGDTLEINFATSAGGRIRIGLADASGAPIAGRSLAECDLLYGDQIDRVVSWGGDDDLARLAGEPVRLTVELKDADLYALRIR